jgi:hypothetical protein
MRERCKVRGWLRVAATSTLGVNGLQGGRKKIPWKTAAELL